MRKDPAEVLVLNFANPFNPGGGVRRGAKAQEEDLRRKSSLLLSLESDSDKAYYNYHRELHSPYSSDAIILSPKVQIIKDANNYSITKFRYCCSVDMRRSNAPKRASRSDPRAVP